MLYKACNGIWKGSSHPHRRLPSRSWGPIRPRVCSWFRSPIWHECQTARPKGQVSMEQENRLAGQKNYHHNSREELFVKKKILKSLMDVLYSTRTIRRHLNNEKIKQNKIHCPRWRSKSWSTKRNDWNKLVNIKPWVNGEKLFSWTKKIQFRRFRWLSEVLACKKFSRRELLNKAKWISYDLEAFSSSGKLKL